MVPIYGLARALGPRNSYAGLILIHPAIELPFLIWLMKNFFDNVPRYLEEAAWLDGRSNLRALVEVVLPVARDGIGDVADGEFLVLLGPSGCGKTTALRMLAGLEYPDRGDILIDGGSVLRLEPKDRDVALVFQSYALYPHMSVRDNIQYPLRVRKLTA